MRRLFRWISLALLGLVLLTTTAFYVAVPEHWREMVYAGGSVVYYSNDFPADTKAVYKATPTRPLYMHIFKPTSQSGAEGSRVPVVLFHGGAFVAGWPAQFFPHARRIADAGHVVFVPEYRLQREDGVGYQAELDDARDAVSWVLSQASHYAVDPNKLVLGGSSAGSHFPPIIVTEQTEIIPQPIGLLLLNPYLDSSEYTNPEDLFNGQGVEMSAINNLRTGMPEMVLFHGVQDQLIPVERSQNFCKAAIAVGNSCRLVAYPDSGHALMGYGAKNFEGIVDIMIQSIDEWSRQARE
jgi:acetyl esterase